MLTYLTGKPIVVGDNVLIEHGQAAGVVRAVVDSPSLCREWNVNEPGVLIESAQFGLVFLPRSTLKDDPIELSHEST